MNDFLKTLKEAEDSIVKVTINTEDLTLLYPEVSKKDKDNRYFYSVINKDTLSNLVKKETCNIKVYANLPSKVFFSKKCKGDMAYPFLLYAKDVYVVSSKAYKSLCTMVGLPVEYQNNPCEIACQSIVDVLSKTKDNISFLVKETDFGFVALGVVANKKDIMTKGYVESIAKRLCMEGYSITAESSVTNYETNVYLEKTDKNNKFGIFIKDSLVGECQLEVDTYAYIGNSRLYTDKLSYTHNPRYGVISKDNGIEDIIADVLDLVSQSKLKWEKESSKFKELAIYRSTSDILVDFIRIYEREFPKKFTKPVLTGNLSAFINILPIKLNNTLSWKTQKNHRLFEILQILSYLPKAVRWNKKNLLALEHKLYGLIIEYLENIRERMN